MYYAIGDILGQTHLLDLAINHIKMLGGNKIIFIGDYISRGPDSLGVIEKIMNPPEGMEFIPLIGNHEYMFSNGGNFDYFYCQKFAKAVTECGGISDEIKEWVNNLRHFHFEGNNIFAHAAYDLKMKPDEQNTHVVLFYRWEKGQDYPFEGYHLTHGHTPFSGIPEQTPRRTNLDLDGRRGQNLCIGVYEEGILGPIKFIIINKDGSIREMEPIYKNGELV